MAQTWTKKQLSDAGANNLPIGVTPTSTPGENIHLGTAAKLQQVALTATNIDTSDVELTLEIGGTAAANQQVHTIPARRTIELPVITIYGAVQIAAFAGSANKVNVNGEVNEIA